MEFLLQYDLTNEEIEEISNRNDADIIKNIEMNQKNVKEVIDYLLEVGINKEVIKDLFLEQIGMFFRSKDEIQDVFDEYEIESIIKSLNYDVNTVDLIEFS
ncbi:MAG: hypothetical protein J6Y42_01620 [Bacilli bacterium]|nr:hypothetical protein [Bacilli bacterium]